MATNGILPKQETVKEYREESKAAKEEHNNLANLFVSRELAEELLANYTQAEIEMILGVHPDNLRQPLEAIVKELEMRSDNSLILPIAESKEMWQYLVKDAKQIHSDLAHIEVDGKQYETIAPVKTEVFGVTRRIDVPSEAVINYGEDELFVYDVNKWGTVVLPALNNKPLFVSEKERKYKKLREEGTDMETAEFSVRLGSTLEGIILPKMPQKLEVFDQDENHVYIKLPDLADDELAKRYVGAKVQIAKNNSNFSGMIVEVGKNVEKKTKRKLVCEFYAAKAKLMQPLSTDLRKSAAHVDKTMLKAGRRLYFTKNVESFEKELAEFAKGNHPYVNGLAESICISENEIREQLTCLKIPGKLEQLLPIDMTLFFLEAFLGLDDGKRVTWDYEKNEAQPHQPYNLKIVYEGKDFKVPDHLVDFWAALQEFKGEKFELTTEPMPYSRPEHMKTKGVIEAAKAFYISKLDEKYQKKLFDFYKKKVRTRDEDVIRCIEKDEQCRFHFWEDPALEVQGLRELENGFINFYKFALKMNGKERKDLEEKLLNLSNYGRGKCQIENLRRKQDERSALEKKVEELSDKENLFALASVAEQLDKNQEELDAETNYLACENLRGKLYNAHAEQRKLKEQLKIHRNISMLENFGTLNDCLYQYWNLLNHVKKFQNFYEDCKFAMASSDEEACEHAYGHKKIDIDTVGISFVPVMPLPDKIESKLSKDNILYCGEKYGREYRLHLSRVLPDGETKTNGDGFLVPATFNDFLYSLSIAQRDGKEYRY